MKIRITIYTLILVLSGVQSAQAGIEHIPLYLLQDVDANVMFDLSVETPMGGAAYNDQPGDGCGGRVKDGGGKVGVCYDPDKRYIGYFDPNKCYTYNSTRFEPNGATDSHHGCSGKFSGNMLNWATMTAIDEFIWASTGGNRVVDTATETVIRRARKHSNDSWFQPKLLSSAYNVKPSTVTPWGAAKIYIYNTAFGVRFGTTRKGSEKGTYNVRVKVCDVAQGLESNCVMYPNGGSPTYKPQGIIQNNADRLRFSVFSYTFDSSETRDGGVLRANMKYVGPQRRNSSGAWETNPNVEFNKTDGTLISDPDGLAGSGGVNDSGIINYINKFSNPGYKGHDPVGELYYEVVRYFKNLGPTPEYSAGLTDAQKGGFPVITHWDDPITHWCQKNFIVGINDANPWLDKRLPGTYFTSSGFSGHTLRAGDFGQPSNPDTDINVTALTNQVGSMEGLNGTLQKIGCVSGNCDMNASNKKVIPGLGEVCGTAPWAGKENSYYISGLAYYANTHDLRSDLQDKQTVTTYMIDTQEYNAHPLTGQMNMLWLAGKYGGFEDINGNDRPDLPSEWDKDGDGEPDNYVLASDPQRLVDALNNVVNDIFRRTSSSAAIALNSGTIDSESRVYQARFSSVKWDGHLLAYPINADGTLGALSWDAADHIPVADSRNIVIQKGGAAVPFRWGDLDATQRTMLMNDATLLDYLRGDTDHEVRNGGNFRNRPNTVLGDIVHSNPVFVKKSIYRYPASWGASAAETPHAIFKQNVASRPGMVYVGANDGMLHAFDATTGEEKFAYIPSAVLANLAPLAQANYSHRYSVDGPPVVVDAFFGGAWHTVLVGGLRGGGQGIYAIDVTDPAAMTTEAAVANKVLWEFDDSDDADLGYTYAQPSIVRMHNGKWAAVFGNGYHNTDDNGGDGGATHDSTTGDAVLYIVDIENGNVIKKIDTGVGTAQDPTGLGRANGLSTPAPVDVDGDHIVDFIYAGDLFGNLWKFKVTGNDTTWGVAYNKPLFTACAGPCSGANHQPITTRPQVGFHPLGRGYMVYFGTGQYFENTDATATGQTTQSFYAIWDKSKNSLASFNRGHLLKQEVLAESTVNGFDWRVTSKHTLHWHTGNGVPSDASTQLGWYIDLYNTQNHNLDNHGERQVSEAILRNHRIIFTTLLPSEDPCDFGGTSWLMELNADTGGRLDYTPFDVNGDSSFTSSDYITVTVNNGGSDVNVTVPVSGKRSTVGITDTPAIATSGDGKKEHKYASGSQQGQIERVLENPGPGSYGRQSWQQLDSR